MIRHTLTDHTNSTLGKMSPSPDPSYYGYDTMTENEMLWYNTFRHHVFDFQKELCHYGENYNVPMHLNPQNVLLVVEQTQ